MQTSDRTALTTVRHVERPWGCFRQYAHNQPVTVSLMTVRPGKHLSLKNYSRRADLWTVPDAGDVPVSIPLMLIFIFPGRFHGASGP